MQLLDIVENMVKSLRENDKCAQVNDLDVGRLILIIVKVRIKRLK